MKYCLKFIEGTGEFSDLKGRGKVNIQNQKIILERAGISAILPGSGSLESFVLDFENITNVIQKGKTVQISYKERLLAMLFDIQDEARVFAKMLPKTQTESFDMNSVKLHSLHRKEQAKAKQAAIAGISFLILAGVFFFFGKYHIVTSSSQQYPKLIKKQSFGFTETFINIDEITGMPFAAAKSRYPLSVKVLQREDIIESEAALKKRIKKEYEKEVEKGNKKFLEEWNKTFKQ